MVISKSVKALAWLLVILMNLFFVYFSLLRGLERGVEWQRLFLAASLIQLVVEVGFYETSECAIVQYYIPNLARKEVQSVGFILHQAVQSICTDSVSNTPLALDAPRFLFLSTSLANRFPDLFESVVIKSYHSHSPGELSKKWRVSHTSSYMSSMFYGASSFSTSSRVRRTTLSSIFFALLQRAGAMPPAFQRLFIHTVQPIVVAAFFLGWVHIYHNPEYLVIVAVLVAVKLYFVVQEWKRDKEESTMSIVHPLSSASSSAITTNAKRRAHRTQSSKVSHDSDHGDGGDEVRPPVPASSSVEPSNEERGLHVENKYNEDDDEEADDGQIEREEKTCGDAGAGRCRVRRILSADSRPISREMIWLSSSDSDSCSSEDAEWKKCVQGIYEISENSTSSD